MRTKATWLVTVPLFDTQDSYRNERCVYIQGSIYLRHQTWPHVTCKPPLYLITSASKREKWLNWILIKNKMEDSCRRHAKIHFGSTISCYVRGSITMAWNPSKCTVFLSLWKFLDLNFYIYILWLWYHLENIIILVIQVCRQFYWQAFWTTSWSSGRVQDSGLVSRSNPGFNTLPVRLGVPLGKALHAALLLSTQEQVYLCGQICKPWLQVAVYSPGSWDGYPDGYMDWTGPMTREGTCQSLQSRDLSLDVDSKQWLYLYFILPWIKSAKVHVFGLSHAEKSKYSSLNKGISFRQNRYH